MLEFYSGSSRVVDSRRALSECLADMFDGERAADCNFLILYAAIGHNFRDLLDEAHGLCPNARIVGCTCAGIIGTNGADESMKALAAMGIKGDPGEISVASSDYVTGTNSREVGAGLARELKDKNPGISMIHLVASGLDIAADEMIRGIESVFGPEVPVFGATSSDNMKAVSNFQFVGKRVLEQGAVAVGFADGTLEVLTRATHGFVVAGPPFEVTRSDCNRVIELDGRPAWERYTARLGLPETALLEDTIPIGALAEELPVELQEVYGNSHILRVIAKKGDDGSIYMPVTCAPGTLLWLTKRDEKRIFDGLDTMVSGLAERCGGRLPRAVFHADCGARGRLLFNRVLKDEIVSRMQYPLCRGRDVPWLGMYGFGEFAMLGGRNRFHNYTTALAVVLRKDRC